MHDEFERMANEQPHVLIRPLHTAPTSEAPSRS